MMNLSACRHFSKEDSASCYLSVSLRVCVCVCKLVYVPLVWKDVCAMGEWASACASFVRVCVLSVFVFVCVCVRVRQCVFVWARVQLGIIWRSGSGEGQGIKDHKKCMTADNFRLLIKICWYDQSLGLSQTHSRDSGLPGCAADRTTRQLTESGGTGAFSSPPALPPRWNPSN